MKKKTYYFHNPENFIQPRVYRRGALYRLGPVTVRLIEYSERFAIVETLCIRILDVPLQSLNLATSAQVEEYLSDLNDTAKLVMRIS